MIVFFRGRGPVAAIIRWQTRGAYAHCGWLANDGRFFEAHGHGGVQVHDSPWVLNTGLADVFAVRDMTPAQHEAVTTFCQAHVGCGYDWFGVIRFLSGICRDDETRWFCSELVAAACAEAGHRLQATSTWRLSPVTLSWSPLLRMVSRSLMPEERQNFFQISYATA